MKTLKKSFAGSRPVYTVSPVVEIGGYTIDKTKQNLVVGDVIPEGTLVVHDDETRKVVLVKTGKVKAIDSVDAKIVTLESNDFMNPNFAPGDKVAKAAGGAYASAISIVSVVDGDDGYVVTLSAAISGLAVGDVIGEVVKDGSNNSAFPVGTALTISPVEVKQEEILVDITANTGNGACFIRRILPIHAAQLSDNGMFLKANPSVRFTNSK